MVHISTHSAVCSGSVVRNVGPDAGQQWQCPHRDIWQLQQLQHINNTGDWDTRHSYHAV